MYRINWRGDKCRNSNTRGTRKPAAIANHITAGTRGSVYNWFISEKNTNASSHFVVGREGDIDQYVRLELAAWTQGLNPDNGDIVFALAPIVHEMNVNPNLYMVGIEHEGYVEGHLNGAGEVETVNYGLDGELTEKQFWATCWLHKWIQTEVQRIYGIRIPLNSHNVEGHYRIDPRRKPNCPGPRFPWAKLYAELVVADPMPLEDYEERITFMQSDGASRTAAYAIGERLFSLNATFTGGGKYSPEAERKLKEIAKECVRLSIITDATAQTVYDRAKDLYQKAGEPTPRGKEAIRKLLLVKPKMIELGLL